MRGAVLALGLLMAAAGLPAASGGVSQAPMHRLIRNGVIVFVREAPTGPVANLYAISPRGGEAQPLLGGAVLDTDVSWSPDGSRLVFVRSAISPVPGIERIAVANADGSNVREIANGSNPVWSPSGGEIAFDRRTSPHASGVFVIRPDGSSEHRVSPPRLEAGLAAWSPNGRQLAFYAGKPTGPPASPSTWSARPVAADTGWRPFAAPTSSPLSAPLPGPLTPT
jgi:dipeptidyl aminopeptidase/acylaminoacyl peptidase